MIIVGNFSGWRTSTEVLPYDTSGIPPGVVVCQLPQYRFVRKMNLSKHWSCSSTIEVIVFSHLPFSKNFQDFF